MDLVNNRYQIQGLDVLDICQQYDAPLFIYDGATIRRKYQDMVTAFEGMNARIKYPVKALSNVNILRLLKEIGCGLDTVSIQEVRLDSTSSGRKWCIRFTRNVLMVLVFGMLTVTSTSIS